MRVSFWIMMTVGHAPFMYLRPVAVVQVTEPRA
jgi:hypothetical protein